MKIFNCRAAALGSALLASTCLAPPAFAQVTQTMVIPPQTAVVSPGGVDMANGQYRDETTDLTIGPDGTGGISFVRVNEKDRAFRSNWHFYIRYRPDMDNAEQYYSIESRAVSKTYFTVDGTTFFDTGLQGGGAEKISRASSGSGLRFTYTAPDGTTTRFEQTSSGGNAYADLITQPNGVTYSLFYDNGGDLTTRRLRRVKSNTGYELILEYGGLSGSDKITKACVLNAAAITPPSAHTCPASAAAPAMQYTYSSNIRTASITDPTGAVTRITHGTTANGRQEIVHKPCRPAPCTGEAYLTNTYESANLLAFQGVVRQDFADGRTFIYSYEELGLGPSDTFTEDPSFKVRGTGWTENGQLTTYVGWDWVQQFAETTLHISPTPVLVVDPLGRSTGAGFIQGGYSPFGRIASHTLPGGRSEAFGYQGANISQRTWNAVSGSGDAAISTTYTYDCTVAINCLKPVTATDPRGHVTNYAYDPAHGGLLTETLPAAPNGVRPQKRYSYGAFYARYRNSSGTVVQSPTPVWLLTHISECRTSAAVSGGPCAVAGDQVLTAFEYGPGTGANTLLLRGMVVDAGGLSLRTCYTYDAQGNRIAETRPKAGLSSCS